MKKRYFAFTINDARSHPTLARTVKRAAYGVFDSIIATIESKPYQHIHILAATGSLEPNIERFFSRCPNITWSKELDDEEAAKRFQPYILAQERHVTKDCGTYPLIIIGSFP